MTDLLPLVLLAIALLLVLRIRRLFGRHRLSVPRLLFRCLLLTSLVGVLFLLPSSSIAARVLGLILGVALGIVGVLTTKIERVGADLYYWPNPRIGLVVVALLLGRMAQRLLMAGNIASAVDGSRPITGIVSDPWSRLLALAMLTYYAVYCAGILARSRTGDVTVERN